MIAKVPRRPRCRMPGKLIGTEGTCKYPEKGTRRYLEVPRYPGAEGQGYLLGSEASRAVIWLVMVCCHLGHSSPGRSVETLVPTIHSITWLWRENVTCLRKEKLKVASKQRKKLAK